MDKKIHLLDEVLTEKCENAKIPGMALIVAEEGQPIYEKYYGFRDIAKGLPVTGETIFGIASVTKSFASLAVMQLADRGKLSIFDPVIKWLPKFSLPDETLTPLVTIHHLMSHSSGLPGLPLVHQARATSIKQDPDGQYLFGEIPNLTSKERLTVNDLLDLLSNYDFELLGSPGEKFNYSNESYAFLQEIIERASGQSFIDYMDEHLFKPLQMERATFLTEDLKTMDPVTELYAFTQDEKKDVFHSPAWWDVGCIYTNGSLKTSAIDLIKYLEVYRQRGKVNGEQIVSEESVAQMTIPQISTPHGVNYGYGLQVHHRFGHTIVGHGGGIKGVSSYVLVNEAAGLTVVVLTNIANVDAEDLAMMAMQYALGAEDEKEPTVEAVSTSIPLEPYVGVYQSLEGNQLTVTANQAQLILKSRIDQLQAQPLGEDLFLLNKDKKIAFTKNRDGKISGLYHSVRYLPKIK